MSQDKQEAASSRSGNWPFKMDFATRFLDNDQFGHLNNSSYYLIADSIVNTYLIQHCGLQAFEQGQPKAAPSDAEADARARTIGLVISSDATYFAPTSFPAPLTVGLRVLKLGTSSVKYEVGIWEAAHADRDAAVVTHATHVFVDRHSRRPRKEGMPASFRQGLERLVVPERAEQHAKVMNHASKL